RVSIAGNRVPFILCARRQTRPGNTCSRARGNSRGPNLCERSATALHIVGECELAVRIGLKLTEPRRIRLHLDCIVSRREGHDPQPAIASICATLIVRHEAIYSIPLERIGALTLWWTNMPRQHEEYIGIVSHGVVNGLALCTE